MQEGRGKETINTMPPNNPDPETVPFLPAPESSKTAHPSQSDNPRRLSSETCFSKKSKSEGDVSHEELRGTTAWRECYRRFVEEDEKGRRSTTAPNNCDEEGSSSGRERLKRHRVEVAGRVWIPDIWGQENLLKDWIDCTAAQFDATVANSSIMSARASLVEQGRRRTPAVITTTSSTFRLENSCN